MNKSFLLCALLAMLCIVSCNKNESTEIVEPSSNNPISKAPIKVDDDILFTWGEDGWPRISEDDGTKQLTEEQFRSLLVGHCISDRHSFLIDESGKVLLDKEFWRKYIGTSSRTYNFVNDTTVNISGHVILPGSEKDGPFTHSKPFVYSAIDNSLCVDNKKVLKVLSIDTNADTGAVSLKAIMNMTYDAVEPCDPIFCYLVCDVK